MSIYDKGYTGKISHQANGREFVASDVVFDYDRLYGLGDGFTSPSPFQASVVAWQDLLSVTATDNFTVAFKWKTPNPEQIMETQQSQTDSSQCLVNPDAVQLWGNVGDWHHAIGTGPFMLTDFVDGSSASLVKNTNYWGYDERYPQNKLPYIDKLTYLIIPDDSTALAAMRVGKIDDMDGLSLQAAQPMQKTNPEITQLMIPAPTGVEVDLRNDKAPFNDIRVREAMQMALDLPTIAATYYDSTCSADPVSLTSMYLKGYGFPYEQWPQELKNEYAYNPTAAKQLLAQAGYPNGFNTDIVADSSGDPLILQIIQSYFAAIGINMSINTMTSASWTSYVQVSRKQDALAIRTYSGQLGMKYEPIRALNKFQTGYSLNYLMVSDPTFDAFYPAAMATTNPVDTKQIIATANEYVAQQHFAISLLEPMNFSLVQPWLKGYDGQYGAFYGTDGPTLLGFYAARFWIDQKLK